MNSSFVIYIFFNYYMFQFEPQRVWELRKHRQMGNHTVGFGGLMTGRKLLNYISPFFLVHFAKFGVLWHHPLVPDITGAVL